MEQVKQLLRDYLDGKLTSEEFAIQYLKLARKLRDETRESLNQLPGLRQKLDQLFADRFNQVISESEYENRWHDLTGPLSGVTVKPFSEEDEILSHLFVEADAYRDNPADRQAGLHIGEDELRIQVAKALERLR